MRKRWILAAYGVLLLVSHGVRCSRPTVVELRSDESLAELFEVDGDTLLDRRVRVVWNDSIEGVGEEGGAGTGLPVVLLHGSPGGKRDMRAVAAGLAARHRTLSPDLPGFGRSEHDVADYSIRAHAHYVLQLCDQQGIDRFHVVGFSLGGGVALNLTELAPDRGSSMKVNSLYSSSRSFACENLPHIKDNLH